MQGGRNGNIDRKHHSPNAHPARPKVVPKELPKGFQRSEFLLEKGQIDCIVERSRMRDELARLLAYATGRDAVAAYKSEDHAVAEAAPAEDGKRGKKAAKVKAKAKAKTKSKKG